MVTCFLLCLASCSKDEESTGTNSSTEYSQKQIDIVSRIIASSETTITLENYVMSSTSYPEYGITYSTSAGDLTSGRTERKYSLESGNKFTTTLQVAPNNTYFYRAFVRDNKGNYLYGKTNILTTENKTTETGEAKNTENGHPYVQIGNLKVATCNLGASKPEEYGKYYTWNEAMAEVTKWGGRWRLPSDDELKSLIGQVTTEWAGIDKPSVDSYGQPTTITIYGIYIKDKSNPSVSVFLPAGGRYTSSFSGYNTYGYYWTSSFSSTVKSSSSSDRYTLTNYYYWYFSQTSDFYRTSNNYYPEYKCNVRPVFTD